MRIVRNSMVINNCKQKIAFRAETNKNNMKVIKKIKKKIASKVGSNKKNMKVTKTSILKLK